MFGMFSAWLRRGGDRRKGMGRERDKSEWTERVERRKGREKQTGGGEEWWMEGCRGGFVVGFIILCFFLFFPPAAIRYICLRSSSLSCMLTAMLNVV